VSAQQRAFVRLCGSTARPGGGGSGCGGGLAGVDLGAAGEGDPFFDDEFGALDVADKFGATLKLDLFADGEVAMDAAADDGAEGVDVALDGGVFAQVQDPVGGEVTIDFAVKGEVAGAFQVAPDFDVIVEDVLGRSGHGRMCLVACFCPVCGTCVEPLLTDWRSRVKGFVRSDTLPLNLVGNEPNNGAMKISTFVRHLAAGVILSGLCTMETRAADPVDLDSQMARVSYGIGMNLGMQWLDQEIEVDPELLLLGMKDAMGGGPTLMTQDMMRETLNTFQNEHRNRMAARRQQLGEENLAKGRKFLEENKNQPGVVTLPSGLQYKVLEQGEGASPKANDVVTVHYRGTLIDGTEFDSSHQRGEPATFNLSQVIAGWTEGIQLMKPGARYQFFIPSDLAYGERSTGRHITPNSTLIFDVELLSFKSQPAPQAPEPVTSDIIKVPSREEMERGAQIEVIKKEDLERLLKEQQAPQKDQ
jgi:FKBP-type peptidyl-prolyl cis-trans isomerase FklB